MKAVILAGGKGSRMGEKSAVTPKPMTLIDKKPVLEHQINALKAEGVSEFIFVTGHLHEKIEEYFGDGKGFGVKIEYYRETEPLGTAGALFRLQLREDFLLCGGDLIFSFNLKKMYDFHLKNNALATLFTHPNSHPYDSTLVCADEKGRITAFLPSKNRSLPCRNLCNAGVQIISPELLSRCQITGKADLDRDVIMPSVASGRIFSYKSAEYVKDMGTPERLAAVEKDVLSGIVSKKHSSFPQKAVFLDRDGTLNIHKGYITKASELELIEGAAEAVRTFNSLGYLVIVVTNQPVIARGECSLGELEEIHCRLEELLGEKGAYLDGIYFCPHHPDKGFENEVPELKISCSCRKPEPGLLLRAKEDFNIDMAESFMLGDSQSDIEAGKRAGCRSFLIGKNGDYETPEQFAIHGEVR